MQIFAFIQSILKYAGRQYMLSAKCSYPQHIFDKGFIFDRGANMKFQNEKK